MLNSLLNVMTVSAQEIPSHNLNLDLPIVEVRSTYLPYAAFCKRNPGQCDMTGQSFIELTDDLMMTLSEVNVLVNVSIRNIYSDSMLYGAEEYWAYPTEGFGDCEDIALEKRRRLVERGLPRAAMTMAVVTHKTLLMSHAVVLVETTEGTFVLDGYTNNISLWYEAPYNYESRERVDGSWERFDQSIWN